MWSPLQPSEKSLSTKCTMSKKNTCMITKAFKRQFGRKYVQILLLLHVHGPPSKQQFLIVLRGLANCDGGWGRAFETSVPRGYSSQHHSATFLLHVLHNDEPMTQDGKPSSRIRYILSSHSSSCAFDTAWNGFIARHWFQVFVDCWTFVTPHLQGKDPGPSTSPNKIGSGFMIWRCKLARLIWPISKSNHNTALQTLSFAKRPNPNYLTSAKGAHISLEGLNISGSCKRLSISHCLPTKPKLLLILFKILSKSLEVANKQWCARAKRCCLWWKFG